MTRSLLHDKSIHNVIMGVAAWQKLPYSPQDVDVNDVVTPAEALQAIQKILLESLPKKLDEDGAQGKWVNGFNDCLELVRNNIIEMTGGEK